jgi:wyosine [tRNA(Phe)-imidazoG37] synthetase (radical SAM superfamily)
VRSLSYDPSSLIVDISRDCNLSCRFCWRNKEQDHVKLINAAVENSVIPFNVFRKIIDDSVQYNHLNWLSLCGPIGEPLMARNIIDYLGYANGKNHFKTILINTNGLLLHKHKYSELLENLTEICVSIDTINEETYKKIHNSSLLNVVIKNVVALCEHKKKYGGKAKINVRFTQCVENKGEFEQFRDFFIQFVDDIKYVKVHSFAGIVDSENSTIGAYFCNQIYNVVNFNVKGELTTCCLNWRMDPSFGSIENNTIADLWNSSDYRTWVHSRMIEGGLCSNCSGLGSVFSQSCNHKDDILAKQAGLIMKKLMEVDCDKPYIHKYKYIIRTSIIRKLFKFKSFLK